VPTLADKGCRVVSATDPHGRNLGFLDPHTYPLKYKEKLQTCTLHQVGNYNDQVEDDEMDRSRSTNGGEVECI
jgi:hypothetical protein